MGQQETHALQQKASYSITSSARPRNVIGKVRPSVLAVLRLMTNSTLPPRWTGKAAGGGELAHSVNCRHRVAGLQRHDLSLLVIEKRVGADKEPAGAQLDKLL